MGKRNSNQIGLNANHMGRLAFASRNQPQWHSTVMLCSEGYYELTG